MRPAPARLLAALVGALIAGGATVAAPLQDQPAAGADAGAAPEGGSLLDRVLQPDTDVVQRDLDLLLQAREADEGAGPPGARRPLRAPAAAAATPGDFDDEGASAAPGLRAAEPMPAVVQETVQWLRAHRRWLLAAGLLLAAAFATPALWRRLVAAAARQPDRTLSERSSGSRRRRRSSRH